MKYYTRTAFFIFTLAACKQNERLPFIHAGDFRAEVLTDRCLTSGTATNLLIRISNRSENTLKFNPGYFYLCNVFDEKNDPLPEMSTHCPLFVVHKDWYEVGKDSTVSIPVHIPGLHRYSLRSNQKYSIELVYYQEKEVKRRSVQAVSDLTLRSGLLEVCR